MSGPIRQKLGPLTRYLKDRMAGLKAYEAPSVQWEADGVPPETRVEALEDLLADLDVDYKRIADWVDTIVTLDQQWQAIIASDELTDQEATVYNTFVQKNDYTVLLFEGQTKLSDLEQKRQKLAREMNKLKKQLGEPQIETSIAYRSSIRAESAHNHTLAITTTPMATTAPTAQLPKLKMRFYNGDYRTWLPWIGWFQVTVIDQPMTDLQRFLYLVACMEPGSKAEAAIAPIPVIGENFKLAFETLRKVCGDMKKILRCHWDTIFNKQAITSN